MAPVPLKRIKPGTENVFGFIPIKDCIYKSCLIKKTTDLGAYLSVINTDGIPEEFILYSFNFKEAQLCKVIWRTGDSIGAWFDGGAAQESSAL